MDLPFSLPLAPMLAKSVPEVPRRSPSGEDLVYEPKWDGFRAHILRDGDEVVLASRGAKPLTRYFPEVVGAVRDLLPPRCAVDAEIVVRRGEPGAQRLDWEALSQRIHPAESRIQRLAAETPAELVCFDMLSLGNDSLLDTPLRDRRAHLTDALARCRPADPIHVTAQSAQPDVAVDWFTRFEGAGLDGVMAKPVGDRYRPGVRGWFKIKHKRTAEAVLVGYRVHTSGRGVGSLLIGLYDGQRFWNVGGISAFTTARRLELIEELAPLVIRTDDGEVAGAHTDRSRFSSNKDVSFVPLRPERVVEVAFDQLEGHRFRHAVTFLRWRPDRDPLSCLLAQVERAPAYDLGVVLGA